MQTTKEPRTLALVPNPPQSWHPPLAARNLLGRYDILETLKDGRRGYNAAVYKTWDSKENRPVAIRAVNENDVILCKLARREWELSKILKSEHYAEYLDLVEAGGHLYVVREFVDGQTLDKIRDTRAMPQIMGEIFKAVSVAHANGILLQDLKARNLVMTPDGRIKVIEIGGAKLESDVEPYAVHSTIGFAGTPGSTAPEVSWDAATRRSDVWSIGSVLSVLASGKEPYDISEHRYFFDFIPEPCRAIVMKAMKIDPEERYASVEEMEMAFAQAQGRKEIAKDARAAVATSNHPNAVLLSSLAAALGLSPLLIPFPVLADSVIAALIISAAGYQLYSSLRIVKLERLIRGRSPAAAEPQKSLPAIPKTNWDALDLDQVEIMTTSAHGLTANEALAEAARRGKVIVPLRILNRILHDERLRQKYLKLFPAWSGTHVDYDGEHCVVSEPLQGAVAVIRLPLENGYYALDGYGIPSGEPLPSHSINGCYLDRLKKHACLLVRNDGDYYCRRQDVVAYFRPSDRFGVAVVDESVVAGLMS